MNKTLQNDKKIFIAILSLFIIYAGHLKYNYGYSTGGLKPDVIFELLSPIALYNYLF